MPILRGSYSKVAAKYTALANKLKKAFPDTETFGSKKGLTTSKLQKYHFMMSMPYFDDEVELGSFDSYSSAVQKIDANLKSSTSLKKVYEIAFPNKEIKLYGVALKGTDGESSFLAKIDKTTPRHTAFLPYELLVYKGKAYMLHGRFRIALSFPDLSMGTFMKIMSTPGDIEDALESLCK